MSVQPDRTPPNPNIVVVAIVVVVLAMIPAYLWAEMHEENSGPLLTFVGTALVGFLAMLGVHQGVRGLGQQLETIQTATQKTQEQTNGALDARVESAVARAMAARDAATAAALSSQQPTPPDEPHP